MPQAPGAVPVDPTTLGPDCPGAALVNDGQPFVGVAMSGSVTAPLDVRRLFEGGRAVSLRTAQVVDAVPGLVLVAPYREAAFRPGYLVIDVPGANGGAGSLVLCIGSDVGGRLEVPASAASSGEYRLALQQASRDSDGPDLAQPISNLVPASGRWGIGVAGFSAEGEGTWMEWRPESPRLPGLPGDGAGADPCFGARLPSGGSVVAVTAPPGVVPDWSVTVSVLDPSGSSVPFGDLVLWRPPGNRGIVALYRPDGSPWPAGTYAFAVLAGSGPAYIMGACLQP